MHLAFMCNVRIPISTEEMTPPPMEETNFITNVPALGSNETGELLVGMQFTVGSSNIKIYSLGRWKASGNSGTHLLRLLYPHPNGSNVPNGFSTVNLSSGSVGTFVYGALDTPIVLGAGQSYVLVSVESAGGDAWYNTRGPFNHTSDGTLDSGVYGFPITGHPSLFQTGGANDMLGPVDFSYEITTDPVTSLAIGSLYPDQNFTGGFIRWAFVTSASATGGSQIINAKGTINLKMFWRGGSPSTSWSGVGQYYLDEGIPLGSPIHDSGTASIAPLFQSVWDTALVADGTHVVWFQLLDSNGFDAYDMTFLGTTVVVHNSGFVDGVQDVWAVITPQIPHRFGGRPDRLHYDGNSCPTNLSYLPYTGPTTVPPATSDARYMSTNAALLRDGSKWVGENSRAQCAEWEGFMRWAAISVDGDGGGVGTGGGVFAYSEDIHRQGLDASEQASRWTFNAMGFDGTRFDNLNQGGWATFCDHPDGTGWLGVDIGGRLFKLGYDNSVVTIAGPRQDRTKAPVFADIDTNLLGADEKLHDIIDWCGEIVGTFDAEIQPEWMLGTTDLCVDPRDTDIVYTCSEYLGVVFKIDMSTSPATVSRYAGSYDDFGYVDGAALSAKFNSTRSIQMTSDGTLYISDGLDLGSLMGSGPSNNLIRYVTPDGTTVGTLCGQVGLPTAANAANTGLKETYSPSSSTPIPFGNAGLYISTPRTIRLDETGRKLWVIENNYMNLRIIDLDAETVTHFTQAFSRFIPGVADFASWVWFDIDRFGTCGPVGDVILNQPVAGAASERISRDKTYIENWLSDTGIIGPVLVGSGNAIGLGHYGWTISISNTKGRLIMGGTTSDSAHQHRIAQPSPSDDAAILANTNPVNTNLLTDFYYTFTNGAPKGWPINARPAPYINLSKTGQNQIGAPTFDTLNVDYPSFNNMAGYFQSGMNGYFPRPELTGWDMQVIDYAVRRLSFAGSYPPSTVVPTPDAYYHLWYPIVTACSATVLSPTSIQVNWTTDKPTIGMAVAGTDVQFSAAGMTNGGYNLFSPFEDLTPGTYATSHSEIITGLSANHTIHYNVLCKDLLGNFAHFATDQTIVPGMNVDGASITTADLTSQLVTVHGLWSWGAEAGPLPGWGIGTFHRVLLNGQTACPSFDFSQIQKLIVAHGGNVYGLTYDQLYYQWVGGQWQPNDNSTGFIDPPATTPTPPTLPSAFIGPYLPSADNTTITAPTGSVTTHEGVWSFGAVNGSGRDLVRNGQPVYFNNSNNQKIGVLQMKVHSKGHLFYQQEDNSNWYLWASQQPNLSNSSSPGLAVPIEIAFTPSRGVVSSAASTGTFITKVLVIMSDGTDFTGSLSVGLDSLGFQLANVSGMNIVKSSVDVSSEIGGGTFFGITATQNNTSVTFVFNVQVSA